MKTSKLNLENHPTLFDLTPYTISIVAKAKGVARKAIEVVKETALKVVEKVTQKKEEHPTLFKLSAYTLTLAELKEMAQRKRDNALLAVAAVKASRLPHTLLGCGLIWTPRKPKSKPAPKAPLYCPEGIKDLAEAMLSNALYELKALSKKAIPTLAEIQELKEFFSGIGQMMTVAGIGSGDATEKLANQILRQAEDRLPAAT